MGKGKGKGTPSVPTASGSLLPSTGGSPESGLVCLQLPLMTPYGIYWSGTSPYDMAVANVVLPMLRATASREINRWCIAFELGRRSMGAAPMSAFPPGAPASSSWPETTEAAPNWEDLLAGIKPVTPEASEASFEERPPSPASTSRSEDASYMAFCASAVQDWLEDGTADTGPLPAARVSVHPSPCPLLPCQPFPFPFPALLAPSPARPFLCSWCACGGVATRCSRGGELGRRGRCRMLRVRRGRQAVECGRHRRPPLLRPDLESSLPAIAKTRAKHQTRAKEVISINFP